MTDLNRVIAAGLQHTNVYYTRGVIYFAQKNYSKAIADFSQSISLDPKFAQAYGERARCVKLKGVAF